jgi:hypothetical protein
MESNLQMKINKFNNTTHWLIYTAANQSNPSAKIKKIRVALIKLESTLSL